MYYIYPISFGVVATSGNMHVLYVLLECFVYKAAFTCEMI